MHKIWIGILAYVVPSFPLAYLWHLTTFAENYRALNLLRTDVILPFGLITMVIQGALYSWGYPKLFSTVRSNYVSSAIKCGCVYGLIAWSYAVLAVAAKIEMSSIQDFMLLETGWTILQFAVTAPLLAFIWRDKIA
jgi:hypothetical protein